MDKQAKEAEDAVIGACLLKDDDPIEKALSEIPTEDVFFSETNKLIYKAIRSCYEKQEEVNAVSVAEYLEQSGDLAEVGGSSEIANYVQKTPSASGVEKWCEILRDRYERREIEKTLQRVDPYDQNLDTSEIKNQIVTSMSDLDDVVSSMEINKLNEGSAKLIDFVEKAQEDGIPPGHLKTGMPQLTERINYIAPNDFIIVVAESGVGKTTYALQIADFVSHKHGPVMVYTGEMMDYEIALKMIAKRTNIEMDDFIEGNMDDDKWDKFINVHTQFQEQDLHIVTEERPTVHNFITSCRKMVRKKDVELIILDYLQYLKNHNPQNFSGDDFYNYISSVINDFTKKIDVPIIAISRTNRSGEAYGSKQFNYDCNYKIRIEAKYDEHTQTGEEIDNGKRIIDVEKARLSDGGVFPMIFEKEYSRFRKPQKGEDFK